MSTFNKPAGDPTLINIIPVAVAVICIVMNGLPHGVGWFSYLGLSLFLVPIFHIGLASENDLTALLILCLGLFNDLVSETPLGYWAFLFCIFYLLSMGQRVVLYNGRFSAYWAIFSVLTLVLYVCAYIIGLLRDDMQVSFIDSLLSAIGTAALYPLINLPLEWLNGVLGQQERQ